jgi:hypothetical protein
MNTDDLKKYREILSEAWQTAADKQRGLVRHGPKPEPTDFDAMEEQIKNFNQGHASRTVDMICTLALEGLAARKKNAAIS